MFPLWIARLPLGELPASLSGHGHGLDVTLRAPVDDHVGNDLVCATSSGILKSGLGLMSCYHKVNLLLAVIRRSMLDCSWSGKITPPLIHAPNKTSLYFGPPFVHPSRWHSRCIFSKIASVHSFAVSCAINVYNDLV